MERGIQTLKRSKGHELGGGNPNDGLFFLNTGKLEVRGDFFPGKICELFACKRNYFVLQSETATFACWRKRNVECINVTK